MKPTVSDGLREQVAKLVKSSEEVVTGYNGSGEVPVGTNCKNNGCKQVSGFFLFSFFLQNKRDFILKICSL